MMDAFIVILPIILLIVMMITIAVSTGIINFDYWLPIVMAGIIITMIIATGLLVISDVKDSLDNSTTENITTTLSFYDCITKYEQQMYPTDTAKQLCRQELGDFTLQDNNIYVDPNLANHVCNAELIGAIKFEEEKMIVCNGVGWE